MNLPMIIALLLFGLVALYLAIRGDATHHRNTDEDHPNWVDGPF